MNAPSLVTLDVAEIKPYGRNPRQNAQAVQKVKESITRYGYNQLIAVDHAHVIVIGHTRYAALKELGWEHIPVLVLDLTANQAKAYRLVDNKTSEYAHWTKDLATELRELGDELPDLKSFFPDIGAMLAQSVGSAVQEGVSADEVASVETRLATHFKQTGSAKKEIVCANPKCGKHFFVTK
jgi:hypothetical protein